MSNPNEITKAAKQRAFITALALVGTYNAAARAAGIDRRTAHDWRQNPDFQRLCDDALEEAGERLQEEAHRRAVLGVDEPVVYQGNVTYVVERDALGRVVLDDEGNPRIAMDANGKPQILTTKHYSDKLLELLLKANVSKFRDSSRLELSGQLDINTMSEDEIRAELAQLIASGAVPGAVVDGHDLV